jgi:hypothetical protein
MMPDATAALLLLLLVHTHTHTHCIDDVTRHTAVHPAPHPVQDPKHSLLPAAQGDQRPAEPELHWQGPCCQPGALEASAASSLSAAAQDAAAEHEATVC